MEYARFDDSYVLRLEIGDDISESLLKLARAEDISLASVSGIGATDDFTVGVFNLDTHAYDTFRYTGNHEITSLTGNLTTMNGEKYAHLHVNCANGSGTIVGGHLISARISLTAEIIVHTVNGRADRRRDEELGINLISFGI